MAVLHSAPMKQSLRYHQVSCRLEIEGLPDVSAGQGPETLGILTGWTLEWAGRPQLEGRREHLLALLQSVLPYARHLLSGVARPFGGEQGPVRISPAEDGGHRLHLLSSQPDTPPLEVRLDDAELADLVRVLDEVRLDPRVRLSLPLPQPRPLAGRDLRERIPLGRRLAAPVGGAAALVLAALGVLLLPEPRPVPSRPSANAPASPGGSTPIAPVPTIPPAGAPAP